MKEVKTVHVTNNSVVCPPPPEQNKHPREMKVDSADCHKLHECLLLLLRIVFHSTFRSENIAVNYDNL